MVIYLIIFVLLLYASPHMNSKKWMYFWGVCFVLLIGLRGLSVGVDTKTYKEIYDSIYAYGYNGYPEPLYGLSMLFFSKSGLSFLIYNVFIAIVTISLVLWTVNKTNVPRGYAIVCLYTLYFVFYSMNVSRQILALSVLCISYYWLSRNRRLRFLLLVLIATMIHYISIVAIVALVLNRIRLNVNRVFILLLSSMLLGMFLSEGVLVSMLRILGGDYVSYLVSGSTSNGFRAGSRVIQAIVLCSFWSTLFVFVYRYIRKDLRNNLWIKLYFLSILVNNLVLRMELGLRVTLVFSIAQVIAIPLFLKCNVITPKYSSRFIVYTFLSVFFLTFLFTNSAGIVPYKLYEF